MIDWLIGCNNIVTHACSIDWLIDPLIRRFLRLIDWLIAWLHVYCLINICLVLVLLANWGCTSETKVTLSFCYVLSGIRAWRMWLHKPGRRTAFAGFIAAWTSRCWVPRLWCVSARSSNWKFSVSTLMESWVRWPRFSAEWEQGHLKPSLPWLPSRASRSSLSTISTFPRKSTADYSRVLGASLNSKV